MYIINTIPHGKCFVRYLRTRCFCIRNRTSERSERVRFLIRQQLVRKYRTPALSMKYSLYMCNVPFKYTEIHINLQFLFSQGISDLRFKTTFTISGFYLRVNTVDLLFKPRLHSVYESHRLTNF